MNGAFLDYYRCPPNYGVFRPSGSQSARPGFFRWGQGTICYGRSRSAVLANRAEAATYDAQSDVEIRDSSVFLPFDPEEITENLRRERYSTHFREPSRLPNRLIRKAYYHLRPFLSVPVRKRLQKVHLRDWNAIAFPEWPVDFTVDRIQRKLMALTMRAQGIDAVPFIWFWPDGYTSCAIITHDVEAPEGKDYCRNVMDLDESFGFRSSFQIVPEERYTVSQDDLARITTRGFEVNVHDLKHDGRLYAEREEFLRRAARINDYARQFDASGFRSGVLYRNADWYEAFDFQYDMSIPNVGHLDPQRGGCCTVMPYFIGKMVELPLTCTQDYTLFHILDTYSIDLWKQQIDLIMGQHGLISILVHPDYIIEPQAQDIYKSLLAYLSELRDTRDIWAPLPKEVASWWQLRSQMGLSYEGGSWQVKGRGSERARIAFARFEGDSITYSIQNEKFSAAISKFEQRPVPASTKNT